MTKTCLEKSSSSNNHEKVNSKWRQTGIPPDGFTIEPPDGKYSWIVLLGCCLSGMVLANGFITFGILLNDIVTLYDTTVSTVTLATSIAMAISYFCAPLVPIMTQTYSCRRTAIIGGLLVTLGTCALSFSTSTAMFLAIYGICTGIGCGLTYPTFSIVLSQYFKKYFGIATGLLLAGTGCTKIILAPVMEYLRTEYGCRSTMLIAGAITLNCCAGAAVFQPLKWHTILVSKPDQIITNLDGVTSKDDDGTKECKTLSDNRYDSEPKSDSKEIFMQKRRTMSVMTVEFGNPVDLDTALKKKGLFSSIDGSLWKEPMFYLASFSNFIVVATLTYAAFFFYPLGLSMGLKPMQSAFAISTRGIGEIIGRALGPIMQSYLKLSTRISTITLYAAHGAILIILINANSVSNFMTIGIVSGLVFGFAVGLKGQLIMECVGRERLPSFVGLSPVVQGILVIPFGPFIGWVHDITGSYTVVFLIFSGLQFAMCCLWILKPYVPQFKQTNT